MNRIVQYILVLFGITKYTPYVNHVIDYEKSRVIVDDPYILKHVIINPFTIDPWYGHGDDQR